MTLMVEPPINSDEIAAQKQLRDISASVHAAQEAVTAGKAVTLETLSADIDRFCHQVPNLSPPLARRLLPAIETILATLDKLQTQLQARSGSLNSDNGAVRQRATHAYQRRRD
jgi:hypothetical protein